MSNRKRRRTYDKEFKKEAVRLVLEEGYSKHESIISVGNRGLIFSSRHSYVPTDNDGGNTSYYYYEYNCPTE